MARRFDLGRALLAVGSILLLASLFLEWYDTGQSGWEVFETLDLVLAALAVGGVYAALRADALAEAVPAVLAGAALVVVVVQLLNAPPAAGDGAPSTGAWLALAAALLMAAGAVLSMARFAVTIEMREHDRRRRVPAVDRRERGEPAVDEAPVDADDLGRTETFTAVPPEEGSERA